jgi:hypothetical protein
MRCEDCLPLVEEYFDGEAAGQIREQMAAHLSACADCSAALDALAFEQEVYARYDRGGLEVTPDLWARVSAEIARAPLNESPARPRPFLSRARESFAAATALFAARPALASSMALLMVAAAVGTLWLSRRPRTAPPPTQVAQNTPAPADNTNTAVAEAGGTDDNQKRVNPIINNGSEIVPVVDEQQRVNPRAAEVAVNTNPARRGGEQVSVDELLREPPAPKDDGLVRFRQEHAPVDETAKLLANAPAPSGDLLASNDRPLDPEEKDVARHVERAQMLLRSIKNVRTGDSDISYEKNLSRKLLAENSTLQLEAEVKGDKGTQQVLDRIEPFLLEIANMGEKPSREEVRSIQERVRKNEIVAELEVY